MSVPCRIGWTRGDDPSALRSREWLVANGLGGYASGTVGGVPTRRFHGLLVAALPAPHGRMMLVNDVTEEIDVADGVVELGRADTLTELRFDRGLPVWQLEHRGTCIEKRVLLPHGQNTTYLSYRLSRSDRPVTLRLRPWVHARRHDGLLARAQDRAYRVHVAGPRCEIDTQSDLPTIQMFLVDAQSRFVVDERTRTIGFEVEQERGYDWEEELWSPGWYDLVLAPGQEAALVVSSEPWERASALSLAEARESERDRRDRLIAQADPRAQHGMGAELVLAADQFIINPRFRRGDSARARASGSEAATVIAGYHWFTDWGRDTMISLEGLTLVTGRHREAEAILRTFAHYVKDGLLPNLFPEGESEGLYHTADATLWFFHAVHRYLVHTSDLETLRDLLPTLEDVIAKHIHGTRFGIAVDPIDGLLMQGAEGYQLTWMDAKVGNWVVTPRRGKAVEINALFYNALRLLEGWLRDSGRAHDARAIDEHAERVRVAFNARFWCREGGYLYDVVDGPDGLDGSFRPNQVLAISLAHPVLDRSRWADVVDTVQARLVTPLGLRSLAPGHPDYKATYDGDLHARDAAYHQGTVWGWLIGPFLDAFTKTHPAEVAKRAGFLAGFVPHLGEAGVGSISEVFDAEAPYTPRGCIAQAWSVAEVLRSLVG